MLNFLKQSRNLLTCPIQPICIVIGNESCDLDSAVSAVSLAYFYQKSKEKPKTPPECNFVPILNICQRDYPIKTEVNYLFGKYGITDELLTFRDEVSDDFLKSCRFCLVDHHVSPWSDKTVAIYDHRPLDKTALIPEECDLHMHMVGSCATLIADLFIQNEVIHEEARNVLEMLRGAIVLDTVNFSKEAARATSKDIEICSKLEEILEIGNAVNNRKVLFDDLVRARSDVSSLTAAQLLRKDNKILASNKDGNMKIAIPGFPMPVKEFITKGNAEKAIREFAMENKCAVVLLMGMFVNPDDNAVHRDIGLINFNNGTTCEFIKQKLETLTEPNLSLEQLSCCNFMNGSFYKQGNIRATRKHILPVVKSILDH
ncbi:exopolyphosphatase PRUNE1 [Stomoxys calcitrans]|uniref:DHHA2 domain-containing protein n=1 Tax=Stomoxys calcitrans TaxID=35570 RepID=A0A1I8NM85_STOCA|nr:exopolyphosphatase PRUNE1 [Stomoxys calcitrans]